MINLIEKLEKGKFIDKMTDKAYSIYKDAWQRKLVSDAYIKGVKDTIKELQDNSKTQ